jgi:single-stranded-DNA-specific exonuclease
VEERILRDALQRHEALEPELRDARGLVLWSDEWHPGVVGIVASRLVERLRRPVVLVAVEGEEGRGSGRSLPVYDLHAGLAATSEHLVAFGGHRVAAGVTVRTDCLDAFARAFAAHADAALTDDDLAPLERVDAVASLADVSLDLADELARLEPFGLGNPGVSVLLPGVELGDARTLGADGKHLRFVVRSSAGSCRVVQWGAGRELERLADGRYDVVARVERNDWNGTSAVQLVARGAVPLADAGAPVPGECATPCDATCAVRARPSLLEPSTTTAEPGPGGARRRVAASAGALAELVRVAGSGGGVLVVVADVARRRALLRHVLHPSRFGLAGAVLLSRRCGDEAIAARLQLAREGAWLALVDADTLARHPETAEAFRHVAVLDPCASPDAQRVLEGLPQRVELHELAGPAERAAARRRHEARAPRALAARVWRALGEEALAADELHAALLTSPDAPDARECVWALEVLVDAGLAVRDGDRYARAANAPARVDLALVPAFAAAVEAHEEAAALLAGDRAALPVAV